MGNLTQLKSELKRFGSKEKAKASAWFFKTGKGQYGEGDKFLGVSVPEQRKLAKEYKDLSLSNIKSFLQSDIHEYRLTALIILVGQFEKADEKDRKKIVGFYLKHKERVNNWDLVDTSAGYILGQFLQDKKDRKILYKLARSKSLWDQRIAIISTYALIRDNQFSDTFKISKILLDHEHDLIHKAVGWMLREVGNRDQKTEEKFLKKHYKKMPRTMLRYAIEKFEEKKRKKYLNGEI
ncbi:MAG TPA: DNA alkylation repair protein [bacterium]|nr:DNA alkylation repair protein [bacterium]